MLETFSVPVCGDPGLSGVSGWSVWSIVSALSICSLSWTSLVVDLSSVSLAVDWAGLEEYSDGLSMFCIVICRAEAMEASILYHCWTIVIYDVLFVRLCGDVEWLLYRFIYLKR